MKNNREKGAEAITKIRSVFPQVPKLDGLLRCEDHRTYVMRPENYESFIRYWAARWYMPTNQRHQTNKYPGQHIALLKSGEKFTACSKMVWISMSDDEASPINMLLRRYGLNLQSHGWGLQHIAYNIAPEKDFWEVRKSLEKLGTKFMTPILEYHQENGAFLKQMFVACLIPYGPFVEIVQRWSWENGEIFQDFNTQQIDALYSHYDAYSKNIST